MKKKFSKNHDSDVRFFLKRMFLNEKVLVKGMIFN